jgi:hypothetical protein
VHAITGSWARVGYGCVVDEDVDVSVFLGGGLGGTDDGGVVSDVEVD